jgi:hypothetical protein
VQGVVDLPLAVLLQPRTVGVFDPQEETPVLLAREREIEHRHVCRADVGIAGGRRGDAQTNRAR